MTEKHSKRTLFSIPALAFAVVPAWAHPGHGVAGLWHHLSDWAALFVLVGMVVFAARIIRRRRR